MTATEQVTEWRELEEGEEPEEDEMLSNGTIIFGDREFIQLTPIQSYEWDHSKVMDLNIGHGSSCSVHRVKPGIIVKVPDRMWWIGNPEDMKGLGASDKAAFENEEKILIRLGVHPRVTRYLGLSEDPRGLLFQEASHGSLWDYIKSNDTKIELSLRLKWRSQAAEAVEFLHQNGIIHCDIRPDNFLLHCNLERSLDLQICDFGGSAIDGQEGVSCPSAGFGDPNNDPLKLGLKAYTPALDIFALGSTFYVIMTGLYPYRSSRRELWTAKEVFGYEAMVERRFGTKDFPPMDDIVGGDVILGCWNDQYQTMKAMIKAQEDCFAKRGL